MDTCMCNKESILHDPAFLSLIGTATTILFGWVAWLQLRLDRHVRDVYVSINNQMNVLTMALHESHGEARRASEETARLIAHIESFGT